MKRTNERKKSSQESYTAVIPTKEGKFVAGYSSKGLCSLDFPGRGSQGSGFDDAPSQIRAWHELTRAALQRALKGKPADRRPPLDLSVGTDFQQAVWRALCKINHGKTTSYAQVAEAIRRPKALRAVGSACGRNPIPVFVPCHRVLAANEQLGGFSAGLDWKLKLLGLEGSWPKPGFAA
jgi:methylated-DNA-[protein]-cysteine S-methyltransferase